MRTGQNFGLLYCLLLICQVLLCNYFQFTPFAMLALLPAMILCVPLTTGTIGCMFLAFGSGMAVDMLAEGIIGLNTSALLPVAILRKPLIRMLFGEDLIIRKDSFSIRKYGRFVYEVQLLLMEKPFNNGFDRFRHQALTPVSFGQHIAQFAPL